MVALLLVCGALLLGPLGPELGSLPSCQPQPTGLPVRQPPSPAEHTEHRARDGGGGEGTPGVPRGKMEGGRCTEPWPSHIVAHWLSWAPSLRFWKN